MHDHLHLPPVHADEIIQGLLGWIDELTLKLIRSNTPVWISREAFSEQYRRLLHRYQDITFIRETEEALIPVTDDDRAKRRNKLFVKQLHWIGLPLDDEDDRIFAAIDAHIRSAAEITRLSKQGVVSVAECRSFDDRLITRWKRLKDIHVPRPIPSTENEQKTVGRELLVQTLNHREPLAGQLTSEYYLTEGAYHHLADYPPRIGWHPQYSQKAKEHEKERETSDATGN